jgi:hypothetical protein
MSVSECPFVCQPVICLSVCPSVCLSISLSVCLCVCLYVCLSICLSVYLSVCVCVSVCLSVFDQIYCLKRDSFWRQIRSSNLNCFRRGVFKPRNGNLLRLLQIFSIQSRQFLTDENSTKLYCHYRKVS